MSIVKSLAVGNGDMFYIKHNSDSFTIIDCNMDESNRVGITSELLREGRGKTIKRFISTHPDEDHFHGLKYLFNEMKIPNDNFYCVKNAATKEEDTVDFRKYCELRDSTKAYPLYKGCSRRWLNESGEGRGGAGIEILWPDTENGDFQEELKKAKKGESFNNISPIFTYAGECGIVAMWMGDMETDFLNKIKHCIAWPQNINVLFAPHHGRDSAKVPTDVLKILKPKFIVIGEAPSNNLNYYSGYNTITQNTAGSVVFEAIGTEINIYVANWIYAFRYLLQRSSTNNVIPQKSKWGYYIDTITPHKAEVNVGKKQTRQAGQKTESTSRPEKTILG